MCTDLQWITDARIISVPNRHSYLKYSPGGSFTHFRTNIAFSHQKKKSYKFKKFKPCPPPPKKGKKYKITVS